MLPLVAYDDFRTGLTFAAVRAMLWVQSDDPTTWRHKRRGSVLGLWRAIKREMYAAYLEERAAQEEREELEAVLLEEIQHDTQRPIVITCSVPTEQNLTIRQRALLSREAERGISPQLNAETGHFAPALSCRWTRAGPYVSNRSPSQHISTIFVSRRTWRLHPVLGCACQAQGPLAPVQHRSDAAPKGGRLIASPPPCRVFQVGRAARNGSGANGVVGLALTPAWCGPTRRARRSGNSVRQSGGYRGVAGQRTHRTHRWQTSPDRACSTVPPGRESESPRGTAFVCQRHAPTCVLRLMQPRCQQQQLHMARRLHRQPRPVRPAPLAPGPSACGLLGPVHA